MLIKVISNIPAVGKNGDYWKIKDIQGQTYTCFDFEVAEQCIPGRSIQATIKNKQVGDVTYYNIVGVEGHLKPQNAPQSDLKFQNGQDDTIQRIMRGNALNAAGAACTGNPEQVIEFAEIYLNWLKNNKSVKPVVVEPNDLEVPF